MRVLLDEHLPLDLARELQGHDVQTVVGRGWAGVRNGAVGVVLVRAASNRMVHLRPLVPAMLAAIAEARPGRLQRVPG